MAALDRAHRVGRARNRRLGNVGGMGIADRLILDGAEPETLRGVVGRLLQAAIVEQQRLGLAVLQKQFAIVGPFKAALDQAGHFAAVESAAVDQRGNRLIHAFLRSHR